MQKLKVNNSSGNAEVYLYGEIGKWMDVDANNVVRELERLQREKNIHSVTFYVNSGGGDVMQGMALYNYLERCGLDITWVVDGIAASMMAMLMCNRKHTVKAAKYAKLMYHRVTGYVYGNSDEIRSAADMVDTFEDDLISMMSERTGISKEEIKETYFDGTDHWMSVSDAVMLGLVDEVVEGTANVRVPEAFDNAHDARRYYDALIINHKNINIMPLDISKLVHRLGLNDDAGEEAVNAKIDALMSGRVSDAKTIADLKAENKRLSDDIAGRQKAEIEKMVQDAVDAKKISAGQKDTFVKLARQDYASTKAALDGMKGVQPIAPQLENESGKEDTRTWDELHKTGELENIKSKNPERYAKLYKEKFGREPQNQ